MADATIGVAAHRDHLETSLSHRTRLLDHLSVGLPTVATGGDPLTALMETRGAARTVVPGSSEQLGEALAGTLHDTSGRGEMARAARALGAELTWESTLRPLLSWLDAPGPAADRKPGVRTGLESGQTSDHRVERMLSRARLHLDDGGPRQLVERAIGAGRRRLGR